MSLAQTYRSQLAAKQNRHLFIFLALAGVIHGVGAVAATIWYPEWLLNKIAPTSAAKAPIPLEFMAIESSSDAAVSPKTDRRAQVNSTAGGSRSFERSTQTGKAASLPISPLGPPSPIIPLPSSPIVPTQSQHPTTPPVPSYRVADRVADPASKRFASPQPEDPSRSRLQPTPQPPSAPPSPRPVASGAAALQPAESPAHSIALGGEGINGQLNPDRSAAGAGVDAAQDNLWGTYLTALNQAVDQHWQRVTVAATRRTRVQFRVDRRGQVTDLRLLQSSGDTVADQAAIQAVQAAAPFAPLPQNAPEEVLVVNFTFTQWLPPAP